MVRGWSKAVGGLWCVQMSVVACFVRVHVRMVAQNAFQQASGNTQHPFVHVAPNPHTPSTQNTPKTRPHPNIPQNLPPTTAHAPSPHPTPSHPPTTPHPQSHPPCCCSPPQWVPCVCDGGCVATAQTQLPVQRVMLGGLPLQGQ